MSNSACFPMVTVLPRRMRLLVAPAAMKRQASPQGKSELLWGPMPQSEFAVQTGPEGEDWHDDVLAACDLARVPERPQAFGQPHSHPSRPPS